MIYLICTVTIISLWNQPHETGMNKRVTFGVEEFLICAQTEEILLLCYLGNDTMREENKIIHVPNSLLSSSTNIYFEEPQCRFLLRQINNELCPPPKSSRRNILTASSLSSSPPAELSGFTKPQHRHIWHKPTPSLLKEDTSKTSTS